MATLAQKLLPDFLFWVIFHDHYSAAHASEDGLLRITTVCVCTKLGLFLALLRFIWIVVDIVTLLGLTYFSSIF